MEWITGAHFPHHTEDIRVRVDNRDHTRPQHQNGQSNRVSFHISPLQHAYVRVVFEGRLVEPQERGAAQHGCGYPREGHPALASGLRLEGFVAQGLSDGEVAVDADPHEGVDGHGEEGDLQVAHDAAEDVSVDPLAENGGVDREGHDEDAAQEVRHGEGQEVAVDHLRGTWN